MTLLVHAELNTNCAEKRTLDVSHKISLETLWTLMFVNNSVEFTD